MMARVLVARRGDIAIKISMDSVRVTIGRDKKSDLFLDDPSVSRRHGVLIFKNDHIYIENVSATGQILKAGSPVEFAELESGDEVQIGAFTLHWQEEKADLAKTHLLSSAKSGFGSSQYSDPPAVAELPSVDNPLAPSAPLLVEDSQDHASNMEPAKPDADFLNDGSDSNPNDNFAAEKPADTPENLADFIGAPIENAAADNLEIAGDNDNAPDPNAFAVGAQVPVDPDASSLAANQGFAPVLSEAGSLISAEERTRVSTTPLSATLKLVKGEGAQRDILLKPEKDGWIIGRGSKSDIFIENPKISRTHFKIYRQDREFRIADLGGSGGTRVNGVSIQDTKLHSFDTINAGPVEFQFIVGEKELLRTETQPGQIIGGLALAEPNTSLKLGDSEDAQLSGTQNKTLSKAPVPFSPMGFGGPQAAPIENQSAAAFARSSPSSFHVPNTGLGATAKQPRSPFENLKEKFEQLTPVQKAIWGLLFIVLVLGAAMGLNPEDSAPAPMPVAEQNTLNPSGEKTTDTNFNPDENAAVKGDIDPAYFKLPKDKRDQIDAAYAQAERAALDNNWDEAFRFAKEVIDAVNPYKNANQILFDAQNAKNNSLLGNISANLNTVSDAAKENQEKIELLLEAGLKSLQAEEWQNAEENFLKAMALDPSNARAADGYAKARARDMGAISDAPDAPVVVSFDMEAKEELIREVQFYNRTLNEAREMIRAGQFNGSLAKLRNLDLRVKDLDSRVRSERSPASVQQLGSEKVGRLQFSIREAIDAAKLQLEAQYQTRLADAEAFISNRQYIQAKEIYHKILRLEPQFDRVVQERNKLYARLISEAREKYQEALIYESVGNIDLALEGFEQSKDLLQDVDDSAASDYYRKSQIKLRRLKR